MHFVSCSAGRREGHAIGLGELGQLQPGLDKRRQRRGRKAIGEPVAGGDGFADSFPTAALSALLKTKLAQPLLSKADWVKIGAAGRV